MIKRMLESINQAIKILRKVRHDVESDAKYDYDRIQIHDVITTLKRIEGKR